MCPSTAARLRLPFALLALAAVLAVAPRVRAEAPSSKTTPVYVLDVDSDDADDQADALTQALRTRVRASHGWSLLETQQSLATLLVALKCPPRPDAGCLQRIGDQIRGDRFIWGTMTKKGREVTAELHLWARGKPDASATETYSENLKDPGDPALVGVAARALQKLTGTAMGGTVTAHAGTGGGALFVDGVQAGTLEGGVAKVDVAAGQHVFEVRVPGYLVSSQKATVALEGSIDLTFPLTLAPVEPPPGGSKGGISGRKVVEFSLMGLGAATLVVSGIEAIRFTSLQSDATSDDSLRQIPNNTTNAQYCTNAGRSSTNPACTRYFDAADTRTIAWVTLGVGSALTIAGAVLWMTDHPSEEPKDATKAARVHVVPQASPTGAGMQVVGAF